MFRSLTLLLGSLCCLATTARCEEFSFHHVQVLGTDMSLRIESDSLESAQKAESLALSEIDRLSRILSSYDDRSELRQWISKREMMTVSPELKAMLKQSERWTEASQGAFQPGIESLTNVWKDAEAKQEIPSPTALQSAVDALKKPLWKWNSDRSQVASSGSSLSFNAIAKGYILDRVAEKVLSLHGLKGGLIAIGGDMRCFGQFDTSVNIRQPLNDLAGDYLASVSLHNQAIATSSGAFRGVTIQGKRYSHLLDPRTGLPVEEIRSVSIVAPNAADADALATTCSVLSIDESLQLINSLPGVSGLIINRAGEKFPSKNWTGKESKGKLVAKDEAWNGGMELKVDFAIHQGSGGRYRRPYVAVWVEDKDGFPVKTMVLWVQSTGPGPRWIPDLKRWYKSDRLRKLADDKDLVESVSEATRKPGTYTVIWNGEDDNKKLVSSGEYTLYIEAAREHGTYQLIKKKLQLDAQAIQEKLDGNEEIDHVAIEYRKKEQPK